MKYLVTIQPAGVQYLSKDNILDDALEQSISLQHSCKTGDCGVCSSVVLDGVVENENAELITTGSFLACKSIAKSDLTLSAEYIPELVKIKSKIFPCKLVSYHLITKDILLIKLKLSPKVKFDYLPGQYVTLCYKGIRRSYSIANEVSGTNEIELHIRKVHDGEMSSLLFNDIQNNQLMRIEGPKGTFFVRKNSKDLIFLATGTGIAPIKSIVENLTQSADERNIHIYWGVQYERELYCNELFKLSVKHDHVKFNPVLSRDDNLKFKKGYVQNAVLSDFSSLKDMDVYACGSIKMIQDAKTLFLKHQLSENSFYSDAFTPTK